MLFRSKILLAVLAAFSLSEIALGGPFAQLTYVETGFPNNINATIDFSGAGTEFVASTTTADVGGKPAYAVILLDNNLPSSQNNEFTLTLDTYVIGAPLAPGTYDAQRVPMANSGLASFDFSLDHLGFNNFTGQFTINAISYSPSPTTAGAFLIDYIDVNFTAVPMAGLQVQGHLVYNSVPEPSTLILAALGGLALLAFRRRR